jgi:hypothetical protein
MNLDVVDQVIKFSQEHPYLSFLMFSLIWFYAVTKTFQAFADADEKLVLLQKHIVEMGLAVHKAAGKDPLPASDVQDIVKLAANAKGGYVVLVMFGTLVPITAFAFLTGSKLLFGLVLFADATIVLFLIYRAIIFAKNQQKLKEGIEKATK